MKPDFSRVLAQLSIGPGSTVADGLVPRCTGSDERPDCDRSAGYRTDHWGVGPCFACDPSFRVAGVYQGTGPFSDALKKMSSAKTPIDRIKTQIVVKQAIMQVYVEQANELGRRKDEDGNEEGIPIELLSEIKKLSNDITRDIEKEEKLTLAKIRKIDVSTNFVRRIVKTLSVILRTYITDQDLLSSIGEDLKAAAEQILKDEKLVSRRFG